MINLKKIIQPLAAVAFVTITFIAFQNFSEKSSNSDPIFEQCHEAAGLHSYVKAGFNLPPKRQVAISDIDASKNAKNFADFLQRLIDSESELNPKSVTQILIPSGNYQIEKTIELKSGVWLKGSGARGSKATILTLKHNAELVEFQTPLMPVLSMFMAEVKYNIGLSDFIIDMNGRNQDSLLDPKARAHTAIALLNILNSEFTNLVVKDFGKTKAHPGGQGILLTATTNGGSFENKFSNIKLNDSSRVANFGLRALSDWKSDVPDEIFPVNVSDNLFENFYIDGAMWNAIEIAGPGTQHNTIRNMIFKTYLTAFEADKAAKYNLYEDNRILSIEKRPGKRKVILMRDQGMPANFHARNPERFAIGNEFRNNRYDGNKDGSVTNIGGQNASMMRIARNKCLKISNNSAVIKSVKNYQMASMFSVGHNSSLETMVVESVKCTATNGVQSQPCVPQVNEEEDDTTEYQE